MNANGELATQADTKYMWLNEFVPKQLKLDLKLPNPIIINTNQIQQQFDWPNYFKDLEKLQGTNFMASAMTIASTILGFSYSKVIELIGKSYLIAR